MDIEIVRRPDFWRPFLAGIALLAVNLIILGIALAGLASARGQQRERNGKA
jgi:uncharacterized membrane protein YedE/YeeE